MSRIGDADNEEDQQLTSAEPSKTEQNQQPRRNQKSKVIPFSKTGPNPKIIGAPDGVDDIVGELLIGDGALM